MSGTSIGISIPRISAAVLVAAALAVPVHAADRGKRDGLGLGARVSVGGIKAGVDARVGGSKGLADVNVGAETGGKSGLKADARANVGGSHSFADADVKAGLGGDDGVNARATANVGGSGSLADADVRATVGGRDGLAEGIGATIGGGGVLGSDVDVSLSDDAVVARPDRRDPLVHNPADDDRHGDPGDPGDRTAVRAFSQLPGSERMQLLKRCRGVDSGGYDAALVKLCRLLETAAR